MMMVSDWSLETDVVSDWLMGTFAHSNADQSTAHHGSALVQSGVQDSC